MEKIKFLVTHDGLPHTDDFSCVALLSMLFEKKGYDNVELIRTRDEKILNSYKNNPDAIIFDIGGGELDHHYDKNFNGGRMYSSIGKVWAKYKEDIKSTFEIDEVSWSEIDKNIVAPIDLTDNTGNMNPLNYVFNSIRSVGISLESGNINDESMDYCGEFIMGVWENILEAETQKTKDRVEFEKLPIIELVGKRFKFNENASRFIPVSKCEDGIVAYIFATTKGTFSVREIVPGTLKKGMMKDESLGVVFSHKTGFIGEVNSLECVKNILA